MKKILIALTTSLLLFQGAHAQSKVEQPSTVKAQDQLKPELNAAAVAELEEAKRLSLTVVKLYGEGKYDEALKPARRALEIREKILGPDHELVTSAVGNLASVYMSLGDFKEAEPLYQRLLPEYEKQNGAESQVIAQMLEVLAFLRYTKADKAKAEEYYQRALAIREKLSGPMSQEVAQTLYNLAEFYQATENFKKAEPLYQRALAIREIKSGETDSKTVDVRERYACLLRKTDRSKEAEALQTRGVVGPSSTGNEKDNGKKGSIEGGVLNGKALNLPAPRYPPEASALHVHGTVAVLVTINEEGRVIRVCALSGPAPLWRASEGAAARAIFTPTRLSGQPVKVMGVIHYNFVR
ncbi:MAG TPA: tetratricopeptide repeat protein [Pyrinomonadaceae bacterium]|jgi:tetratricopeptide (TPR) repeat protein|nr:tetratricopeptide repeat protein [Pyrinomonadaceae bacterium]